MMDQKITDVVLELFKLMITDNARENAFAQLRMEYCEHCGAKQPLHGYCQCSNDA